MVKKWYRQDELRARYSREDVPNIDEIARLINNIHIGKSNPEAQTARAKALLALYYLTACRGSELIKCSFLRVPQPLYDEQGNKLRDSNGRIKYDYRYGYEHDYEGIKRADMRIHFIDGNKYLVIRTENRKHKQRKTKILPIPISKEGKIVQFIKDYVQGLQPEQPLFDFERNRATQIINETLGWNLHFMRHIRATHLVMLYDFNEHQLIRYMGWTDSRPAKHYIELNPKDIARQFYRGNQ